MKALALLLLPLVTACGRWGFDQAASSDAAAADAALDRLACGVPAKFSVGTTTAELAAAATPHGYDVLTVDGGGGVQGFAYEFQTGTLVPRISDVSLASDATGSLGAIALGDQLLLAAPYGRPDPKGTALIPLDAQLAARAQPAMNDGWFGSISSLAPTSSGTAAFLGQLGTGEVDAKLVSPLGVDLGAAHPVIGAGDGATRPTIQAAGTGFLVVWQADAPSPNEVRAEILDQQLAITTPATTISFEMQLDSHLPRAGYSAASDTYVFAWVEKLATGADEVWISVRDGKLVEKNHIKLGSGTLPAIAAGDSDFLIVWKNDAQLDAARVTADAKITPLSVLGSGGKPAAWDLAVNNGQPVLVWAESGGTGPNLWIDPLCN